MFAQCLPKASTPARIPPPPPLNRKQPKAVVFCFNREKRDSNGWEGDNPVNYINTCKPILAWHIAVSVLVFAAFGFMFFKMTVRHKKRIIGYEEEFRPIWNFFDLKGYIIMAVMMGGGIGLRYSGVVPEVFIAVFYTGLGCALSLAGVLFFDNVFPISERKNGGENDRLKLFY